MADETLTEDELRALRAVRDNQSVGEYGGIARQMGISRQKLVPLIGHLERARYVKVKRYSKMTIAEITDRGRTAAQGDGEQA
jgi:DNA-binding MarR family transcriptional regulator